MIKIVSFFLFSVLITCASGQQSILKAPKRSEGEGPFKQLIIRGVTVIDGTGAPPIGPMDIEVRDNLIYNIVSAGYPGMQRDSSRQLKLLEGGKELDASGMYALPGFIDMHGHIGGVQQGTPAEYVFKLWLAHGITTVRDPSCGNGLDWVLDQKQKSLRNEITAPRIYAYTAFGQGASTKITTAAQARAWVRSNYEKGADGIKFFGAKPEVMAAALQENKRLGLRSCCHHSQMDVARWNVLHSARAGLTSMEHWYGLPEALFSGQTIQNYPADYNYGNEQNRFEQAGNLWMQAAEPGSDKWNAVTEELLKLDFTLDPTFNIYEANRDWMRSRTAEWHAKYTLPSLWKFYEPSRQSHGSYWFQWGTEQEIAWKKNYQLWMRFVNEYKNRGGRVTTGSDNGFIYQTYGFGYIRELELLREAGFNGLEIIRSATLNGAEALGADSLIGTLEPGKKADLVLIRANPLQNLKYLYGTGTPELDDQNKLARKGGIDYVIKDGIIYIPRQLLNDVEKMVQKAEATSPKNMDL